MAQLMTVRLSRNDGCPWGFRLQGGKDFGTPLVIQKVNGGSPAERAGLIAGDSVIKVNNTDVFNLRHKDAQDVIVRAGQSFELTVQRGGSTWKPSVTPVGSMPRSQPVTNNIAPVTKTSLAAQNQSYTPIGAAHNLSPKGFNAAPHMNGDGPKLVNKQYNSPIGIYSEQTIAETLSAQAEVLSTGALGVNFKKNEKTYNADKSEVLKMLQEVENEPRSPEPAAENASSGLVHSPVTIPGIAGLRHVTAPETRPAPATPTVAPGNPQLPPGQNICADCERLIVGVFVRIKDKNLHVECFKCATCGSSLKNVGYYNINNKLYCDIHAKLAARSNPPAPNLVPVTIPPGGKVPAGTISAALSSHSLPSPSPLSPSGNQYAAPFQNSKQDSLEIRYSPNNTLKKEDAVVNLMSALKLASKRDVKENGTNTEPCYLTEKIISVNTNTNCNSNDNNSIVKDQQYPSATIKYMPYRPMTGGSFTGPKPFSSVQPSTPTHSPVVPPLSNTLPRSASSTAMPEHANEELNKTTNEKPPEREIFMSPISSEMYIPIADYNTSPKFNSIDLRVPVEIVKDKFNSPDQEVFQINTSRSYDNSPVQFDGNLRNFMQSQLENGMAKLNNNNGIVKKEQNILLQSGDSVDSCSSVASNSVVTEKNSLNSSNCSELGLINGDHPVCNVCNKEIKRGPFITALGKIWCPDHFMCTTPTCRRPLQDMGFVEENGQLYCEYCFEQYLAPLCGKCNSKIKGDCLNAIGKHFHPECFTCAYCSKLFGNSPFFLEDGLPYCEADWNELFTTKCFACGFPVEAGDRWVEALSNNYHSQCFNCTMCKKNLEGQSFYAKGGRPFCKNHAR